jgi:DNA-binding XRE family transcriptional regulator
MLVQDIGRTFRDRRKMLKITQPSLAELAGISVNSLYKIVEAPIKLTTSGRGKLTTCFAGEDLDVQVYQG